jgi:CDP-glucose 4,6-dehydratase
MPSPEFWQDRRVLVTGCTGMLGAWLTEALVGLGADVVGLIRDWVPQSQLVRSGTAERIKVVRADVTDAEAMTRVFSDYEVDTCFHLAAQTTVGIANRSPVPTLEVNIRGAWYVLEAARLWPGLTRLVVASSDKAYGSHPTLPYTEAAPLRGSHPYDVSKSCADLIAHAYAETFGLPVAITRCGNMYGGGDLNWNRVVPGTIRSLLRGQRPIIRSDGTMRRDYIYVGDIVTAYLTLAEAMEGGRHRGEAFNFGLDSPLTVLEMVQAIIAASDRPDLQPVILNEARNEIQEQYLSSAKAQRVLGWRPEHTLQSGLRNTIGWYQEFLAA